MPEKHSRATPDQSSECRSNAENERPSESGKQPHDPEGTYIGFDFGEKRIGLATGHTATLQASPLATVRNINGRPEWDKLDAYIAEWRPVGLVVGLPIQDDGKTQQQTVLSSAFARKIGHRYSLPVFRCDERYSSIEASGILAQNRRLGQRRRKVQRTDTDKIAAAVILDNWLSGSMAR